MRCGCTGSGAPAPSTLQPPSRALASRRCTPPPARTSRASPPAPCPTTRATPPPRCAPPPAPKGERALAVCVWIVVGFVWICFATVGGRRGCSRPCPCGWMKGVDVVHNSLSIFSEAVVFPRFLVFRGFASVRFAGADSWTRHPHLGSTLDIDGLVGS